MLASVRGFTVIELMVVVAVVAVLAALAGPAFQSIFDRQRVKGAAENFTGDVQFARSEAVRRNAAVSVTFSPSATPWCYGIVAGTGACDCTASNSCDLKTVSGSDFKNVSMTPNPNGNNGFSIDPRQGRISAIAGGASGGMPQEVEFNSSSTPSAHLKVQLNVLGRLVQCSPNGTLAGYPTCQ